MLRHFAKNQIELVAVLTINWNPIAGAPREIRDAVRRLVGGHEKDLDDPASAIEVGQRRLPTAHILPIAIDSNCYGEQALPFHPSGTNCHKRRLHRKSRLYGGFYSLANSG
jgi:hypothetical protein